MISNHLEQIVSSKHELEDHIVLLRELDKLRKRSAELRDKGFIALKNWLMQQPKAENHLDPRRKLDASLIQADVAVTLYHLSRNFNPALSEKMKEAINGLSQLSPSNLEEHSLPVLNAVGNFHVLVKSPNSAFSENALCCFYHILREVYTADTPDWSIGGLRAVHGGPVSAYMTSICLHALYDFAEAQENTAKFLRYIRCFLEQLVVIVTMPGLKDWKKTEIRRLRHSYHLTLGCQCKSIVLCFDIPEPGWDLERYILEGILCKLVDAIEQVQKSFKNAITKNNEFRKQEELRISRDDNQKKFERSELGHKIAIAALNSGSQIAFVALEELKKIEFNKAISNLKSANFLKVIKAWETDDASVTDDASGQEVIIDTIKTNLKVIIEALKEAENKFNETALMTRKSHYPAENYLKGVLDHQLAVAESGSNSPWEPYELACAAECLGAMDKKRWSEDKRLARSVQQLSKVISERGLFPFSQPYHSDVEGGQIVPQSTIANIFSELVLLLPDTGLVTIETEIIQRLIHFFDDTLVDHKPDFLKKSQNLADFNKNQDHMEDGWCHEHAPIPRCAHPAFTKEAVQALTSINNLLDKLINTIILDHFTVRRPEDIKLNLDDLFYPDYGLVLKKELEPSEEIELKEVLEKTTEKDEKNQIQLEILTKEKGWSKVCMREESVAITLQAARAHVLKTPPQKGSKKPVHSLVLHGPEGTGKTTLVEALAKSCDVPLVEVTPSDIVMGGMEAVERSARTVFEALSFLTRTVILFDEFDPVLWRRNPQAGAPNNVFSFLTPGMLPKLKNLHDKTDGRSVAYVLSTNLIGSLDNAAVRGGRFDEKIGIFPPDELSRKGRLYNQYFTFKRSAEEKGIKTKFPLDTILKDRINYIVQRTKGGPMDTLGKPSWFTKPKLDKVLDCTETTIISEEALDKTPFGYLIFENQKLEELELGAEIKGIVGVGKTAIKEWVQWYWVSEKDK